MRFSPSRRIIVWSVIPILLLGYFLYSRLDWISFYSQQAGGTYTGGVLIDNQWFSYIAYEFRTRSDKPVKWKVYLYPNGETCVICGEKYFEKGWVKIYYTQKKNLETNSPVEAESLPLWRSRLELTLQKVQDFSGQKYPEI